MATRLSKIAADFTKAGLTKAAASFTDSEGSNLPVITRFEQAMKDKECNVIKGRGISYVDGKR